MAQATLRFRLLDGTDLGPFTFSLSTTVGALKEALVRDWPKARAAPPPAPPSCDCAAAACARSGLRRRPSCTRARVRASLGCAPGWLAPRRSASRWRAPGR